MIKNSPPTDLFSSSSRSQELSLLLQAIDSSISGIIITDHQQEDNPIIYCNKAFEKMSGYSRSEIIGHNCRFLQQHDRNQEARFELRKAIQEGRDIRVDVRNYRKDGTLFWNELYMSPIRDSEGEVTHFIGVQNDITRRRKAEEELKAQKEVMAHEIAAQTQSLRENEEYLASIIETVRESLVVLSPELAVIGANEFFFKTFKVSPAEIKGRMLFDLGDGQWNIAQLKTLLEQVLPTSNPVLDFEVEYEFPHIGKKLMLLNAYRVELEGKYKDRILLAIEDITERRNIETRKDDFLSIASHELKTPLTTIKGYIQMIGRLVENSSNVTLTTVLSKTTGAVDRLNDLITELLDVSRIQSGKLRIEKERIDLDQLIADTVHEFEASAPQATVHVSGSIGEPVNCDESHIIQVLNNLMSNALKYSPKSSPIRVIIGRVANFVKVSVIDQGVGINTEDQKYVFDRFWRAEGIHKKFPGMGIGLYICEQIIKQHEGTLWVESQPGKGSNFSFTLPIN